MKKVITITICLIFSLFTFAQEWESLNPNIIHSENAAEGLLPILVGIGLNNPSNQFHVFNTTDALSRLESSGGDAYWISDIVGNNVEAGLRMDQSGATRASVYWTQSNAQAQTPRFSIASGQMMEDRFSIADTSGRISMGAQPLLYGNANEKMVNVYINDNTQYNPASKNLDGLFLFNSNSSSANTNRGTSVIFGGRHLNSWWATAAISGVVTGTDRMDLVFQNEIPDVNTMSETMRIRSNGFVGIGSAANTASPAPSDKLHVFLNNGETVRFENLPLQEARFVTIDAQGRLGVSACSCNNAGTDERLESRVNELEEKIEKLESMISTYHPMEVNENENALFQNTPNPSSNSTIIRYKIIEDANSAQLIVTDMSGRTLENRRLDNFGEQEFHFDTSTLPAGIYSYTLVVDGAIIDTKLMVISLD